MTSPQLETLLERCRKAKKGRPALDAAIWYAVFDAARGGLSEVEFVRQANNIEPFSSSIDAAVAFGLKVVPDANNHGYDTVNGKVYAYLSRYNVSSGHWLSEECGNTVPLAFVCAALARLSALTQE